MIRKTLVHLSLVLLATAAFADDRDDPPAGSRFKLQTTATHSGSSPFAPPNATDKLLVVDTGSGLDTGCTYRSGGPLMIQVPIKRVVGQTNTIGELLDPNALKAAGLISNHAKLTLPVFDIDVPSEVDHVYFNGHFLGALNGSNGQWTPNTFQVPIEWVRFGFFDGTGNVPGQNTVEIRIDVNSPGESWCMSVDWVQLQFDAVAPIALVHGIAAQGEPCWYSVDGVPASIPDYFYSLGVPFRYQIDLQPNGSPQLNGLLLGGKLDQIASGFGTKELHLIVHSKGGNDSRWYLTHVNNPSQLKILSLTSLSTPYSGSVLADIISESRNPANVNPTSTDPNIKIIIGEDLPMLVGYTYQVPCCDALASLRPASMLAYNGTVTVPPSTKFYNFGADADLNNDGKIVASENQVYPNVFFISSGNSMADAAYQIMKGVMTINVVPTPILDSTGYPVSTITKIEKGAVISTPFGNDLAVTTWSAEHPAASHLGVLNANHTTIKAGSTAQFILNAIRNDYPIQQP